MSLADDRRETTSLDTHGLLVKDQSYRAVLTSRRIILTSGTDHIPRSIILQQVWRIGQGTDPSGDPTVIISIPSAGGTVHNIILHFPIRTFPNALRLRDLWYSEISKILQQSIPGISPISLQASLSVPAFCSKCGNRLAGGSAFCDRCGASVPGTSQPLPASGDYGRGRGQAGLPDISLGNIGLPPRDRLPSVAQQRGREKIPVAASPGKGPWKKRTLSAGSIIKKPAVIGGIVFVAIVIVAAALMMTAPSGSHAAKPASSDQKFSLPVLGDVGMPTIPVINTGSGQETPDSPAIRQEPLESEVTPARSALTLVPGDPGELLSKYPSLFNSGDSAGLRAILSENMKSHHPLETLDSELAAARTKGYRIQKIRVLEQILEEGSAIIDADITWTTGVSSSTSSPKLFLLYENDQWKLDCLILNP